MTATSLALTKSDNYLVKFHGNRVGPIVQCIDPWQVIALGVSARLMSLLPLDAELDRPCSSAAQVCSSPASPPRGEGLIILRLELAIPQASRGNTPG